jgi:aconitase B
MKSAEELRAEARHLRAMAENIVDPALKRELAEQAFDLSARAETVERSQEAPEILRANIARYRNMLAAGIADEQQRRIVEEMLSDAEEMLAKATHKA